VILGGSNAGANVGLVTANSYNGSTIINNGSTLLTGTAGALPTATPSDVTLGSNTDGAVVNTLDLLGTSQTVASLTSVTGTTTTTNQIISSNGSAGSATIGGTMSASTGNLTVNVASGTNTYSGLLGDSNIGASGRNANNFSLTKSGTGTLALTRSSGNLYSGGTTISAGTLIVSNTSGSATGSGAFNLGSLGIVTGTGSITSSTNTISGTVNPGTGPTDTTSILTMTASSSTTFSNAKLSFNLDTASTHSTSIALGSTASVLFGTGSTLTLNLVGAGIVPDTTEYVLFTSTATVNPYTDLTTSGGKITNFGSLIFTNEPSPGYYTNSYLVLKGSSGNFSIDVEVVPEPGTWALMLGGLALLVVCQRSRRSKS